MCIILGNGHQIRLLKENDTCKVAKIHVNSLPNDVIANLGVDFVLVFYREILRLEGQYLIGYFIGSRLVGFILVSCNKIPFLTLIFNKKFMKSFFNIIIKKPFILYSAVVQSIYRIKPAKDSIEVSFFAVDPGFQGKGIGKEILTNIKAFINNEYSYIQTKTNNIRLQDFYLQKFKGVVMIEFSVLGSSYSYIKWQI